MRLARHGEPGDERPLVSGADGLWRDLGTMTPTGLLAAEYGPSSSPAKNLLPTSPRPNGAT